MYGTADDISPVSTKIIYYVAISVTMRSNRTENVWLLQGTYSHSKGRLWKENSKEKAENIQKANLQMNATEFMFGLLVVDRIFWANPHEPAHEENWTNSIWRKEI